ncbi:hypothetical protein [Subtercola boreus]|uniref:hypothetical protein n=1 Tax=Subtercola boreus TaxID=120213 RepID=UPI001C0E9947|nr:hypothetical protein [Subtercola boreus]
MSVAPDAVYAEVDRILVILEHPIEVERARQISEEGYTAESDIGMADELRFASRCYRYQAATLLLAGPVLTLAPPSWPWDPAYWKPTADVDGNLVKAGALVLAAQDEEKALLERLRARQSPAVAKIPISTEHWHHIVERPAEPDEPDAPEKKPAVVCQTCWLEKPCACQDGQ